MVEISLAWLRSKNPVFAPIVGITDPNELDDVVASLDVTLTEEEIHYLEELYQPHKIVGAMKRGQVTKLSSKK